MSKSMQLAKIRHGPASSRSRATTPSTVSMLLPVGCPAVMPRPAKISSILPTENTGMLVATSRSSTVGRGGGRLKSLPGPSSARLGGGVYDGLRSEEHTSELQSRENLVCRLLLEKKNVR